MNEFARIWIRRLATGHVCDGCTIEDKRYARPTSSAVATTRG
jgi:hypothetical protein